jgi:8-oxo-dGTP diphosphatase
MAEDKIMEVAAGLIFNKGRLLITQRKKSDHLGGLWEFPGGKRESGETFKECLRRELGEELSIIVCVNKLLAEVEHSYPDRKVHLKFFYCSLEAGEPQAIGCQAFAWVRAGELAAYEFPPADSQLLARLKSGEWWREE